MIDISIISIRMKHFIKGDGNTDTIATLTGALAGALYGYNDIPNEWIEKLRGKDIIDGIISSAIEKC